MVAGSAPRSLIGRRAIPGAPALATGAYSLYLTHKMIFHLVQESARHWPEGLQPLQIPVGLIAAVAAGGLLYWSIERPFLQLRERIGTRIQLIPQPR